MTSAIEAFAGGEKGAVSTVVRNAGMFDTDGTQIDVPVVRNLRDNQGILDTSFSRCTSVTCTIAVLLSDEAITPLDAAWVRTPVLSGFSKTAAAATSVISEDRRSVDTLTSNFGHLFV